MPRFSSRCRFSLKRKVVRKPRFLSVTRKRSTARKYNISRVPAHTRGKLVFPTRKFVKLYSYTLPAITSTTGSFGSLANRYLLNNPRDITGAGGTAQPRYFDTLFGADDTDAIYKQGRCYGAKVIATFVNAEKIGDVGMCCYSDDSTAPASFQELGERPYCSQKVIEPNGGTHTAVTLSRYFAFPKMIGMTKKAYMDDEDYFFTSSSNPAKMFNLQLFYQAYGAFTGSVNIKVRIIFYVKCEELADVATAA